MFGLTLDDRERDSQLKSPFLLSCPLALRLRTYARLLIFHSSAAKTKERRGVNTTRRRAHLSSLSLTPLRWLTSPVAVAVVAIVTTMTTVPSAPVAAIRITGTVHPVAIAILAAFPPVAIIVLSGSAG